jgi:hypothetical protein
VIATDGSQGIRELARIPLDGSWRRPAKKKRAAPPTG